MPFSDTRLLNVLSHTFWFLPNVASCYAMYNLLQQKQNSFYHDYHINVCAGTKAGIGVDALEPVQKSMGDPLTTKTITLSCGKLTTGVTVKPWTGIFCFTSRRKSSSVCRSIEKAPSRNHFQDGAFLLWIRANTSRRNRR